MSYFLQISSDNMDGGGTTDSFTVSFSPPLYIPGNWQMSLESMSLWYSYYNISQDYNNQTFRYNNGTSWKDITITPGLYTIDDLNTYIQAQMKANGDSGTGTGGEDIFYISIEPNFNTFKLQINISNSYQVDLTVGNLYQLFGFDQIVVSSSQQGTKNVNITNGVDKLLVHIDCVVGSYVGSSASDVIYGFNVDGPPSSLLQIRPYRMIYLPISKSGYLYTMKFTITDQEGRRINLNGETVTYSIHLRK